MMTPFRNVRAPRINMRGEVSVIVQLENRRQFTGKLHQLSINGGLIEVSAFLEERSKVSIAFQIGSGHLQAKAELFFPLRGGVGYMQPFRFTAFAAGTRQTLEREISALLPQRVGTSHALGTRHPRSLLDSL
jgi:hypothetical protein